MVGTALGPSRLWFTIGFGIVNEVYYPRVDIPQIRDLGFIVADEQGFWCEVKRLESYTLRTAAPGIPAIEIVHKHERFELKLRVVPDPERDVLLVDLELTGDQTLLPYALLAPHLGGSGHGNLAEVFTERGRTILAGEQGPFGLALAAADESQNDAWMRASAGYVGTSDGWQDFNANGAMTWRHPRAGPGNVALIGQLPRRATLALAFGEGKRSAATLAISALIQDFDAVWDDHVARWRAWHPAHEFDSLLPQDLRDQFRTSAMVLRTHQDKTYTGAMVASLSIPWGNSKDDIGGYHLVWPRDLVESALALIAIGAIEDARDILRYLIATQLTDGRWQQNQWLGGTPNWTGVQLDEVAWPVILAAALYERGALAGIEVDNMVRRALGYIMRTGPVTDQDRWEEIPGLNPFTLATCIAALVCGAEFLDAPLSDDALAVADDWNSRIEDWVVADGSEFARRFGVANHYVRTAPAHVIEDRSVLAQPMPVKNRGPDATIVASEQVSLGFLQLVRFGLRDAADPVIRNSVEVADGILKVDTPSGPAWHRYNDDGYGETEDGGPFNVIGRGRLWPLLTGERAHYALSAGEDAHPYLSAMMRMTGPGGMLPEQVWDSEPIPRARLFPGKPTGSAMPLVWAHAEFVKLLASVQRGVPFDRPQAVWQRYRGKRPAPPARAHWSRRMPVRQIGRKQVLRFILEKPSVVRWTVDEWAGFTDSPTRYSSFGFQILELPSRDLAPGQLLKFTFRAADTGKWEGRDYAIEIV